MTELLESLKGVKNKFKRCSNSPLRYAGGKSLAVGYIVEHFPKNLTKVISPFIGGGSVEIALATKAGIKVEAFDVFEPLVVFWNTLKYNKKELCEMLESLDPDRETYKKVKDELTKWWRNEIPLTNLRLATDYFFNHNLSYGPGFLGWMSKVYEDKEKYYRMIDKLKSTDLSNLSVKCKDFKEVIPYVGEDFMYLDPPYYLGGDSKMFKGIYPQRSFPIHHNGFEHSTLRDLLENHKGKFVLSYNDCSWVREAYKDFKIVELSWQYTMGQGETRIGKNRLERDDVSHIKQSHELLIIKE